GLAGPDGRGGIAVAGPRPPRAGLPPRRRPARRGRHPPDPDARLSAEPRLDALFQALADPTRRAILSRLARGPASVSDLAQPFDMALPSLMGHLRKLEEAGLIDTKKDGRVRTCAIVP